MNIVNHTTRFFLLFNANLMNGNERAMNEESIKYHITSRMSFRVIERCVRLFDITTTFNIIQQHQTPCPALSSEFLRTFLLLLISCFRVLDDARREWSTKPQFFNWKMMFIHPRCWWQYKKPKLETQWWYFLLLFHLNRSEVEVFLRCKFDLKTNFYATRSVCGNWRMARWNSEILNKNRV
jgi:hypothetical protein